MASTMRRALRMLRSDSPIYLSCNAPMSRRTRENPHCRAISLAARLFPVPGIPSSNTPRGARPIPASRARSGCLKTFSRGCSQVMNRSIPPSEVATPAVSTTSSAGLARTPECFARRTACRRFSVSPLLILNPERIASVASLNDIPAADWAKRSRSSFVA
ncbi:hypothetical protein D3C86_1424730 [compost metagenome]